MMHLTCPHCNTAIPANNINVQAMTAVCPSCNALFRFSLPEVEAAKIKRRKVKRPDHLTMQENEDQLEMAFRTNFRLDQDGTFIQNAMMIIGFIVVALLFLLGVEVLGGLFLIPLSAALLMLYRLGLHLFNSTQIVADDTSIHVSRKPLPNPLAQEIDIPLSEVEHIRCEETEISRQQKYDTPRYRVFAEMVDGTKKTIVSDLIDDYGFFIAAQLQEQLDQHGEDSRANLDDVNLQPFDQEDEAPASAEALRAYHLTESERRLSSSAEH